MMNLDIIKPFAFELKLIGTGLIIGSIIGFTSLVMITVVLGSITFRIEISELVKSMYPTLGKPKRKR